MEIFKLLLTNLKDWLGLLAPFGVVFGFIWQFWLKKRFAEIKELIKTISLISDEFRPNGGSSLRDAINRIETKITIEQQKTMAIIKSLPLGTWVSDKDGKCVDVNRSLCRIANRTESELKGDNWSNWLHPSDKDEVWEEWQRCVKNTLNFDMMYRFVLSDGKVQKVHGIAYQLRDEKNTLVGFLGTLYAVGNPE